MLIIDYFCELFIKRELLEHSNIAKKKLDLE